MDGEELKKIMPHREPMLLVDEAEAVSNTEAIGKYKVKGDEWFLQGHFPGNPTVPGMILCEMMAQTCCVLMSGEEIGTMPCFTKVDKAKFRRMVRPGDELHFECVITKKKANFRFASCTATVDGDLAVQADFSFALLNQE